MAGFNMQTLIAAGATTNQTSASKPINPDTDYVCFRIVCEAIGATPAISWLIQGSSDDAAVTDGNSFFFPIGYVLDGSGGSPDTVTFAARTGPIVAGTAQEIYPASAFRKYRKYRVVISGDVNVTYRVEMYTTDMD